jgi:cytochrome c peroxidase
MKRLMLWLVFLGTAGPVACDGAAPEDREVRDSEMARAGASELHQVEHLFAPIPETPPDLPGNPLTPEKVELGKMLWFEPRLSSSWLISCNTCHNLGLGGVDLMETSIGHGWQRGPRNAPTVLNAVFNVAQFWDGRAEDLMEQAKGPIQASVEMNNEPWRVEETLLSIPEYVAAFEAAFPGDAEPVTFDNVARALEAFEATLITPGSRFDRYLEGEAVALTETERVGLALFVEKGCAACHNGVNVGGQSYHPFGVVERPGAAILPLGDRGRYEVTRTATDEYVFKAPSLRNVELTPPYFHSGAVWGLEEAVEVMSTAQLGTELTREQASAITAFLRTLTGRQPVVEYPILPPGTDRTPPPDVSIERAGAAGD